MFGEYFSFIDVVPDTSLLYTGRYHYGLVLLSISIAVFASYTALLVAQFAEQTEDIKRRFILLTMGGFTLGVGVWAMHFIGMLGFSIPCGVTYDPWITILSMFPGILAGIFCLHLISRHNKSLRTLLFGGVIFGGGIGVMHYSGMAAMRMDAFLRYDPVLFFVSILVAVALAVLSLWVRYGVTRLFPAVGKHALIVASLVMGSAVSGMHYTAMSAAYFLIGDYTNVSGAGFDPSMLAIVISGATAFLIGVVLIYIFKQVARQNELINVQLRDANAELKFQKIALDNHAIVSMTDTKGNITYANDKFCKISQYSRDELMGKNHRIIKSSAHPGSFSKDMWHTTANGKVWQGEIKNRARDGSFYWVYSTIYPFLNKEGKPYKYISVRTDITAIKETESALKLAKENADKANQAKSEFLANMSHELRTPMHSVLSYSGMGIKKLHKAPIDKLGSYFERINTNGKRLMVLLDDLLDLAKLEAGKMKIDMAEHKLLNTLEECVSQFNPVAKDKNIVITIIDESENCQAYYDEVRIMQVISNLLSNAIKFSPSDTHITTTIKEDEIPVGRRKTDHTSVPALTLSVSDQGTGIPEDELESVFDKFIQSSKTKSGAGGTGLGLAISKEIIEAHGGFIMAKNTDKGGAKFILTLPRQHSVA